MAVCCVALVSEAKYDVLSEVFILLVLYSAVPAVRCSTVQYKTEQYAVVAVARGCWAAAEESCVVERQQRLAG